MTEDKKTVKTVEKNEKKAAKAVAKQPKDRWFTWAGIRKEAKRVVWPKWKSNDKDQGTLENTGKVLIFTGFFALFFVLCDLLVTYGLRFIGIGA